MTTDYIGDGSPAALAAGLRQWADSVPSHARPLLVAAADALAAPVAPALVPLTLEQINRIDMATEWPENSLRNIGPRSWGQLLVCATRAIEAAHGIKP